MMDQLPSLAQLLKQLQHIPYLASKNLYRVTSHVLSMSEAHVEQLCTAIRDAKKNITHCQHCFTWIEKERPCPLCNAPHRNKALICVVESWHELLVLEKTGGYSGLYHVLGGVISPLDGVGPEDLTINALLTRVEQGVDEIILATNQTPEGEATAAYIASKLKSKPIKITCLARGMPVGASLEYMDRLTIYKALSERRPF